MDLTEYSSWFDLMMSRAATVLSRYVPGLCTYRSGC
jgi:hypothetical protein